MTVLRDFQSSARKSGAPASYVIIAAIVIAFLGSWLTRNAPFEALYFRSDLATTQPWRVLTYFLAINSFDVIGTIFSALWMYWIGTTVERELGSGRFVAFFAAMVLIPSLLIWVGVAMLGATGILSSPYLPIAGITIAWATRNPLSQVMLMMVIPVQARWIGWLVAIIVFFSYGAIYEAPLMGAFAAAHLALAYAFASNKLKFMPYGRATYVDKDAQKRLKWERERDDKYFDDVRKREQDREERERLRKLFESSVKDDDEK